MSAEAIVKDAITHVPKAVACAIVDLGSGMMLAIKTVESHPTAVLDVLALATKELFEGDMVQHIEKIFKQSRGIDNDDRYLQEVFLASVNLWHYLGRLKTDPRVVLVIVAQGDVNLGMFLMKARELAASARI